MSLKPRPRTAKERKQRRLEEERRLLKEAKTPEAVRIYKMLLANHSCMPADELDNPHLASALDEENFRVVPHVPETR